MEFNKHDRFIGRLKISKGGVFRVAEWLHDQGIPVTIMPMQMPEVYTEDAYDDGDLLIQQRIEVKRLSRPFTCRKDWPFHNFAVCEKKAYDRAFPKPYKFIYLNRDMTHAAVLPVEHSRLFWTEGELTDSRDGDGATQDVYFCPFRFVRFKPIELK
jgi:hypothetical protein